MLLLVTVNEYVKLPSGVRNESFAAFHEMIADCESFTSEKSKISGNGSVYGRDMTNHNTLVSYPEPVGR